jgi:hypothetical protein
MCFVPARPSGHAQIRHERSIDWLDATFMVTGVSCLLLVSVWGGQDYDWASQRSWKVVNTNRQNGLGTPVSYKLAVDGKGRPGFVKGEATITLADDGSGVAVDVAATAQVVLDDPLGGPASAGARGDDDGPVLQLPAAAASGTVAKNRAIASAASQPFLTAATTGPMPRVMPPPANTPRREVMWLASTAYVPSPLTARSSSAPQRRLGPKPKAMTAKSASRTKLAAGAGRSLRRRHHRDRSKVMRAHSTADRLAESRHC